MAPTTSSLGLGHDVILQQNSSPTQMSRDRMNGGYKSWGFSTSRLETIPLDILYEILGYFDPGDLLILCRVNHNFRNLLMSQNSHPIWQRSRQTVITLVGDGFPPCPHPPGWCPEPRWAFLFFGGKWCHICGTKGQNWPDFSLGRRICTQCARKNLIAKGRVRKEFPDLDPVVLDIIPFTNIGPRSRPTDAKYFWQPDLLNAITKMEKLKSEIHAGKGCAKQKLDNWLGTKWDVVPLTENYFKQCSDWLREYKDEISMRHRMELIRRQGRWVNEFVKIGYNKKDILRMICNNHITLHVPVVKDSTWAAIRIKCEPLIIKERTERLTQSFLDRLKNTYEDWLKHQPPQSWYYLPPYRLFRVHQKVLDIISTAVGTYTGSEDPDPEYFGYLVERFPGICEEWREERITYLRDLIGHGKDDEGNAPINEELAVFQCPTCPAVLFGVSEAAIHSINYGCFGKLELRSRQRAYISRLVEQMGEDPLTATPFKLDMLDRRFRCPTCMERFWKSWRAFTWRQMMEHAYVPNEHPSELVTDPDDLTAIVDAERERVSPKAWICAHCSKFWDRRLTLEELIDHNKQCHGVTDPIEPTDYMWVYNHPRARVGYAVEVLTGGDGDFS